MEIWTGVTDAWLTDWQTILKDRATQLLIKYKSGALVKQLYEILKGLEDVVLWPRMKLRACGWIKMQELKSACEQIE